MPSFYGIINLGFRGQTSGDKIRWIAEKIDPEYSIEKLEKNEIFWEKFFYKICKKKMKSENVDKSMVFGVGDLNFYWFYNILIFLQIL